MIRDILNYSGDVIGTLELPDDTSEDIWQQKLAVYAAPPVVPIPDPSIQQIHSALVARSWTAEQISTLWTEAIVL